MTERPAGRLSRRLARQPLALAGATVLVALYLLSALAPFLAPYGEGEIDRDGFFQAPTPLHWRDAAGSWRARPFVWATHAGPDGVAVPDRSRPLPLRFFVHGVRYRLLGIVPTDRHLFGVAAPGRIHLLGADQAGRDEWTRLLFGAQVSLTVGLVGILVSFAIGLPLGGLAGYCGGWVDALVMRTCEVLLSVPTLYLVLAMRSAFPLDLPSRQVYFAMIVILAAVGWAGLARAVRGMVLSLRRADFVLAAEALGMTRWRVLRRHILPQTLSFVIVAATVAVPGYILGEVVLSFVGMGVQEPAASWGNMLQQANYLDVLTGSPWVLWAPAIAIFVTVLAFNVLGDALRDALDPRRLAGEAR